MAFYSGPVGLSGGPPVVARRQQRVTLAIYPWLPVPARTKISGSSGMVVADHLAIHRRWRAWLPPRAVDPPASSHTQWPQYAPRGNTRDRLPPPHPRANSAPRDRFNLYSPCSNAAVSSAIAMSSQSAQSLSHPAKIVEFLVPLVVVSQGFFHSARQ